MLPYVALNTYLSLLILIPAFAIALPVPQFSKRTLQPVSSIASALSAAHYAPLSIEKRQVLDETLSEQTSLEDTIQQETVDEDTFSAAASAAKGTDRKSKTKNKRQSAAGVTTSSTASSPQDDPTDTLAPEEDSPDTLGLSGGDVSQTPSTLSTGQVLNPEQAPPRR